MKTKISTAICIAISALLANMSRAQNVHHGDLSPNGSLYFKAEPVNNYLLEQNDDDELYYYIHLQGLKKENRSNTKRIPLNLSIVIDKSGSMQGDKINYTKEAVKYVIKQLSNEDVLSIVTYDTYVHVLQEPQRLENKQDLLKIIDQLVTGTSTNLEGGLRKGYELIKNSKKLIGEEMINRVLLLSDGLANVGVVNPDQLSDITKEFFEKERISVSTFGVGNDYNEDLMAKMAGQGGGKYYFIDSPEKLVSIFSEELQGVSNVVAKNTKIKIKFPGDMLSFDKTFLYSSTLNDNILELTFNDVFSEEQKAILVRFKAKEGIRSSINLECAISYSNSLSDSLIQITDNRKNEIKITKDKKQFNAGYNRAAGEGYALQKTGEIYEQAIQASNYQNYEESKEKIKQAKELLENHFKNIGEQPFLKDLYTKLTEYEKIINDFKRMDNNTFKLNIKIFKAQNHRYKSAASFQ